MLPNSAPPKNVKPRPAIKSIARIFIPVIIILLWFTGAAIGGPYFGKVSEVSSNDQTTYLPSSADATKVQGILKEFTDNDTIPAVILFTSTTNSTYNLSDEDKEILTAATEKLREIPGVADGISPVIYSEDLGAAEIFVPISSTSNIGNTVGEISALLNDTLPNHLKAYVTGPAGFTADLIHAFSGIDGILLAVALIAVFIILIVVYRSLLLPIAVLATSMFALTVALLTVWWLAKAEILLLSGQTQGILFILVIGAATDYSLLYVARFREALRFTQDKYEATKTALKGAFEPIIASGSTVIAGLMCLLLSDLKSNSMLGPVASIGIIFAMLSALTLLPAILFLLGRGAFWPKKPVYLTNIEPDSAEAAQKTIWTKAGALISQKPRTIWLSTLAVLLLGALGLGQLQAQGVAQSELVLGASQARDGQELLAKHFAGGSGAPASIAVAADQLQQAVSVLLDAEGVDSLTVLSANSPSGSAPITNDGIVSYGEQEFSATVVASSVLNEKTEDEAPTIDTVMLQATLNYAADSAKAETVVLELREAFSTAGINALVGGVTATAIDTNHASIHDRNIIIPIVLIVILLILMFLLRSIVAPILLVLTTVISFATALGVSALIFNHVFGFAGADPAVPLYSFVFLVALGIDYNIFLATRVREESLKHGTRAGILRGLSVTGGVITSAGLVLAATFAALSVIPILFLLQIAFIVSFGVLIDTFIVRALLVPALFYDIGKKVWWPAALSKGK